MAREVTIEEYLERLEVRPYTKEEWERYGVKSGREKVKKYLIDKPLELAWSFTKFLAKKRLTHIATAIFITGAPIQYATHITERSIGTVCTFLPHKEQGRFWEGVHSHEALAGTNDPFWDFLPELPDIGILPDITVLDHYPIAKHNAVTFRMADGSIYYQKPPTQIHLEEIPENVKRAIVLKEDAQFYEHRGINWRGKAGAIKKIILKGKLRGGSSISEQVAKQIALDRDQVASRSGKEGLERKVVDALGATELEVRYDKEEILNFYANYMNFGSKNYGIEMAARDYLGKAAKDLAFNEALFLTCLLNDPSNNPKTQKGFDIQWEEYKQVVGHLRGKGEITEEEAKAYIMHDAIQIKIWREQDLNRNRYASAVESVFHYGVEETVGMNIREATDPVERFYNVDILTTLGPVTMDATYDAIERSRIPQHASASIVVLDDQQRIKAIIGHNTNAINEALSARNEATQDRRPMGSTFKPLVFSYALGVDAIEWDDVYDESTRLKDKEGNPWPSNWDNQYDRPFTAHGALVNSNNRVAVQIYDKATHRRFGTGWKKFTNFFGRLGIDTKQQFQDKDDYGYALGTQGATTVELAGAYGIMFNQTPGCKPWIIEQMVIGQYTIVAECRSDPISTENPFRQSLEQIANDNKVTNRHGVVGLKTGTTKDALVTRVAGFYHRRGVDYTFVIDLDGQGQSVGGSASRMVAPIARTYFEHLK